MFGDIGNTLGLVNIVVKIDLCNVLMAEKDVIETVGGGRTECHGMAVEGSADFELNTVERDLTMISHFADDVMCTIGNGRECLGILSRTGLIVTGRHIHG